MFVLKAFALFQIPPLGASPGSSLGHTGQAEDTCGHAALSSHAEVRGRESQPGRVAQHAVWVGHCPRVAVAMGRRAKLACSSPLVGLGGLLMTQPI